MVQLPNFEKLWRAMSAKDVIASKTWMVNKFSYLKKATAAGLLAFAKGPLKNKFEIGRMYFYFYDPLYADEMAYFDRFPLMIPIDVTKTGVLGLNMHYLPPRKRAILLEKLMDFATNKKYNDTTRLKLSYDFLKGVSRYKDFEPCLHQYRYDRCRSKLLEVHASEWPLAISLDVAAFHKGGGGKDHNKKFWQRRVWGNHGKKR